ncbi:hypothetical protein RFI_07508 [Reticulomyxa filosa]|uniref:Uncharacterized protein n=1 Tax=Reticulomyxa filosa TaxID=46433 RepID=X6NUY8_RETFI|nr:hypothetical protein RFI_07508 [Reticulomyxa filosa]|eukprot:ETO29614.1 hypothetical protein RFI_07508 [Reticulomyxa filosa]
MYMKQQQQMSQMSSEQLKSERSNLKSEELRETEIQEKKSTNQQRCRSQDKYKSVSGFGSASEQSDNRPKDVPPTAIANENINIDVDVDIDTDINVSVNIDSNISTNANADASTGTSTSASVTASTSTSTEAISSKNADADVNSNLVLTMATVGTNRKNIVISTGMPPADPVDQQVVSFPINPLSTLSKIDNTNYLFFSSVIEEKIAKSGSSKTTSNDVTPIAAEQTQSNSPENEGKIGSTRDRHTTLSDLFNEMYLKKFKEELDEEEKIDSQMKIKSIVPPLSVVSTKAEMLPKLKETLKPKRNRKVSNVVLEMFDENKIPPKPSHFEMEEKSSSPEFLENSRKVYNTMKGKNRYEIKEWTIPQVSQFIQSLGWNEKVCKYYDYLCWKYQIDGRKALHGWNHKIWIVWGFHQGHSWRLASEIKQVLNRNQI